MKKHLRVIVACLLSILIFATLGGCFESGCSLFRDTGDISDLRDSNEAKHSVTIGTQTTGENENRVPLSLVDAVAMVERTSVAIYTGTGSAGSGVLLEVYTDGESVPNTNYAYIITCHHVISGKGVINVAIPDNSFRYDNSDYIFGGVIGASNTTPYYVFDTSKTMDTAVTLIGGDQDSDIAILRLDLSKRALSGDRLVYNDLVFAKVPPASYSARRGESVFAVGNPTGQLPGTVSDGIISYLERDVNVSGVGSMRLMQIDVDTNPGSSGGGLYNLYGELIGITNSGLESQSGLNNAIPVSVMVNGMDNGFVSVARQLIGTYTYNGEEGNFGYVTGRREKLGFTVTKETSGTKEIVRVTEVIANSPSALAGLVKNDVIKKVQVNNGDEITLSSYSQFTNLMANLEFGDTITLIVSRSPGGEKSFTLDIKQFIFCDTGDYNGVSD